MAQPLGWCEVHNEFTPANAAVHRFICGSSLAAFYFALAVFPFWYWPAHAHTIAPIHKRNRSLSLSLAPFPPAFSANHTRGPKTSLARLCVCAWKYRFWVPQSIFHCSSAKQRSRAPIKAGEKDVFAAIASRHLNTRKCKINMDAIIICICCFLRLETSIKM